MADSKLTDLTAVVTPAGTDVLYTSQGGVDKKLTATQLVSLATGGVTVTGTPTDGQIAVWTAADDIEGTNSFKFDTTNGFQIDNVASNAILISQGNIQFANAATPMLLNVAGTGTQPNICPNKSDLDTGLGLASLDELDLIAGGVNLVAIKETGTAATDQIVLGTGVTVRGADATPLLAFGDGDTGFFEFADDDLRITIGGTGHWQLKTTRIQAVTGGGPQIEDKAASASVPVYTFNNDTDTGLSRQGTDAVSLIAGGIEGLRVTETGVDTTDQVTIFPGATLKGTAATPALAFGDGDTGFYEISDDTLGVAAGGTGGFFFQASKFGGQDGSSGALNNVAVGYTTPSLLARQSDVNTGIGSGATDSISLVAGGVEALRLEENSTHIIQSHDLHSQLTADVGSAQGSGLLVSSYSQFTTVANVGDSTTLPATFIIGTVMHVINDGANSMDVFPASGDDAGAGTDTAVAVAAGARAMFVGVTANALWATMYNA